MGELEDDPANDVVDARAQTAARHDAAAQAVRIEEDVIARARELERRSSAQVGTVLGDLRHAVIERDSVGLADVVNGVSREAMREGRGVEARPQNFDLEVFCHDTLGSFRHREPNRRHRAPPYPRLRFTTLSSKLPIALSYGPSRIRHGRSPRSCRRHEDGARLRRRHRPGLPDRVRRAKGDDRSSRAAVARRRALHAHVRRLPRRRGAGIRGGFERRGWRAASSWPP